ncbi:uncharacterized protein G2W53_030194 [Senna tora]|uniref:Uncharacterized protein n=1 Tax=Senna tora TaxID=362788 RepID=A0A834T703_9FABA|nr:uncharacterized protein G2W53_030194 [Senna tora]
MTLVYKVGGGWPTRLAVGNTN